jgi:uncharacterized coiled-coil protein SlyX
MHPKPNFFQLSFAVRHENHPVVKFVQSQANVLEEFVSQGVLQLSIEPSGEDFDYYVYTYEAQLEARIQKLTTSIALYSVEIDKMDTTISAQRERIAHLEAMLAVAQEELEMISFLSFDEATYGAQIYAKQALAKIEAMRGGGK